MTKNKPFLARARFFFALAILTAALAPSLPAQAEKTHTGKIHDCRMPNGYVDQVVRSDAFYGDEDENGIGGTGAKPVMDKEATDKKRIAKDVFILGTIYDFGSICVNGMRVVYDDKTPVTIDGQPASTNALQKGQVVEILATAVAADKTLRAQSVNVEHAIVGPVTRIDAARNTVYIMEDPVRLKDADSLRRLTVGQRLGVSGLRDPEGTIVATSLTQEPAAEDFVYGTLVKDTAGHWSVGKTRLKLDVQQPAEGSVVALKGRWENGILSTGSETAQPHEGEHRNLAYVSLEGYIHPSDKTPGMARICDNDFDVTRLPSEAVVPGKRVIVTGFQDAQGKMTATAVRSAGTPQRR